MTRFALCSSLLLAALVTGCAREPGPSGQPAPQGGVRLDRSKYLLAEQPAEAKGGLAVRKEAKDGEEVVVVGKIGGDRKPWIKGRAAFLIVDPSVEPCKDCPDAWCGVDREAVTLVKLVDEQGQTLGQDARELFGLQEFQTVYVRGHARRDDEGNLTVLASGVFPGSVDRH